MDFEIFYKDAILSLGELAALPRWSLFISAINTTDRVRCVFEAAPADQKIWIVHREYDLVAGDIPAGAYVDAVSTREDEFVLGLLDSVPIPDAGLCIDITGCMRPHLMFLVRALWQRGISSFDALYTEPLGYAEQENTEFAMGDVKDVRPISGFEGLHQTSLAQNEDLLVIGAGYEYKLIHQVASAKNDARKLQLVGFPPLQADFYQQNRLNMSKVSDEVGALNADTPLFAAANDPFATANVLQNTVVQYRRRGFKNFYLSPLSSRPQALGFALYYIYHAINEPISVIYPFPPRYSPDAAMGISRIWKYKVELPSL